MIGLLVQKLCNVVCDEGSFSDGLDKQWLTAYIRIGLVCCHNAGYSEQVPLAWSPLAFDVSHFDAFKRFDHDD